MAKRKTTDDTEKETEKGAPPRQAAPPAAAQPEKPAKGASKKKG